MPTPAALPSLEQQAERLIALGVADRAGIPHEELRQVRGTGLANALLVIHPERAPASTLAPLVEHDGKGGFVVADMVGVADAGMLSEGASGHQPWLHLRVDATFPMLCQRCLGPVDVPLWVERSFRFVPDEATAEALDEEFEEDLLALAPDFDLHTLIEDELLMALPLVPLHEECPEPVPLASSDADFEAANAGKPNPFAALASLRVTKGQD